jgi:ribosomal protein S18 acetylase RimI-like enzyme
MTSISLRRCGPQQARELAELGASAFRESYAGQVPRHDLERYVRSAFAPEEIERQLRDERSAFFLAGRGDRPVGYLKMNLPGSQTDLDEHDTAEIESLYVIAAQQGTGIGGRLLAHAIAVAEDAGARSIWLGVWERNSRAIAFYERIGFRAFGEHGFELGRIRHRDVLMRLDLRATVDSSRP